MPKIIAFLAVLPASADEVVLMVAALRQSVEAQERERRRFVEVLREGTEREKLRLITERFVSPGFSPLPVPWWASRTWTPRGFLGGD